jgi:hypothetical protein
MNEIKISRPDCPQSHTRRAFLGGALGAAAGAGALGTMPPVRLEAPAPAAADPTRLDYQETEHIRQFYARMRF